MVRARETGGLGACRVDGCDRSQFATGWCGMHYNRVRRTGEPGPADPTRSTPPVDGTCMVAGCEAAVVALRLCDRHYRRQRSHGDPGPAGRVKQQNAGKDCSVEGCDRGAQKRGWCGMHYLRWRQYGDPGEASSRYLEPTADGLCEVEGCDNKAWQKRLCGMHAHRLRAKGDVGSPERLRAKAGTGRYVNPAGYVMVWQRGGSNRTGDYVLEHRMVMEEFLGRPLLPSENVHHKNGVRDDNSLENLELWVKAQPAGQRVHDLIDWIVETYPAYVRAAVDGHPHLFVT